MKGGFVIEGDKNLIQLAYEAGIGERNSQGFGMFRFVKK
ncbi:CRISPR-associated endoribonuclease Cas6 [Caldanaerovirga acetigignens]|nr:CRISPR-associated endoribonuclease Cas6 [Caldanaerovirga acetigignens]